MGNNSSLSPESFESYFASLEYLKDMANLAKYYLNEEDPDMAENIEIAYENLWDFLAMLEETQNMIDEEKAKSSKKFVSETHKKVLENFKEYDSVKAAEYISNAINKLGKQKKYYVMELSDGTLGIADGSLPMGPNMPLLRKYTDRMDFIINAFEDVASDFGRSPLPTTNKKTEIESIESTEKPKKKPKLKKVETENKTTTRRKS